MRSTTKLIPSRMGNLGLIELNNPKSLNALTMDMIRSLHDTLTAWRSDPTLRATLFVGTPTTTINKTDATTMTRPVFCAGGDVRAIYDSGMGVDEEGVSNKAIRHGYGIKGIPTADFFREEYTVNHLIATQNINTPQISIWDGVVMGGGVGLSIHGKYRIATERTIFAMPETSIGLFPDVGGMYWLPRLLGGLGRYVALTGARLDASDLLYCGIATHFVSSDRIEELKRALVDVTTVGDDGDDCDCVEPVLMSFHDIPKKNIDSEPSFLEKNRSWIDQTFDKKESVEDIFASLNELSSSSSTSDSSSFAKKTIETLKRMSPTSLKVTYEALNRGKLLPDVGSVLQMEYRMSQRFMRNDDKKSDFYEGIRSVLVDKDRNPKWDPCEIDMVSDDFVEEFFEGLGEENELALSSHESSSKL